MIPPRSRYSLLTRVYYLMHHSDPSIPIEHLMTHVPALLMIHVPRPRRDVVHLLKIPLHPLPRNRQPVLDVGCCSLVFERLHLDGNHRNHQYLGGFLRESLFIFLQKSGLHLKNESSYKKPKNLLKTKKTNSYLPTRTFSSLELKHPPIFLFHPPPFPP